MIQKKSDDLFAGGFQQLHQRAEPFPAHVSELALMKLGYRPIQIPQKLQSLWSDSRQDHTPVFRFTAARNQFAFFQAVQQSRDIRIARNHAFSDLAAGQALRRTTENAENVVLGWRDVSRLQQQLTPARQQVRGSHEADENVLFQAAKGMARFRFCIPAHPTQYSRYNDNRQVPTSKVEFRACGTKNGG